MTWKDLKDEEQLGAWLENNLMTAKLMRPGQSLTVLKMGARRSFAHYIGEAAQAIPSSADATHQIRIYREPQEGAWPTLVGLLAITGWETDSTYVSGGCIDQARREGQHVWGGNHELSPHEVLNLLRRAIVALDSIKPKEPSPTTQMNGWTWEKYMEGMASLMRQTQAQLDTMGTFLFSTIGTGHSPFGDEGSRKCLQNLATLQALLSMYSHNNLVLASGIPPIGELRDALSRMLTEQGGAHYAFCPAAKAYGATCDCSSQADLATLRSWEAALAERSIASEVAFSEFPPKWSIAPPAPTKG